MCRSGFFCTEREESKISYTTFVLVLQVLLSQAAFKANLVDLCVLCNSNNDLDIISGMLYPVKATVNEKNVHLCYKYLQTNLLI